MGDDLSSKVLSLVLDDMLTHVRAGTPSGAALVAYIEEVFEATTTTSSSSSSAAAAASGDEPGGYGLGSGGGRSSGLGGGADGLLPETRRYELQTRLPSRLSAVVSIKV